MQVYLATQAAPSTWHSEPAEPSPPCRVQCDSAQYADRRAPRTRAHTPTGPPAHRPNGPPAHRPTGLRELIPPDRRAGPGRSRREREGERGPPTAHTHTARSGGQAGRRAGRDLAELLGSAAARTLAAGCRLL